jgi:hypothetical protein
MQEVLRLKILFLKKAFTNKIRIVVTCISFRGPCPEGKIIMMENQGQILSSCSTAISRLFENHHSCSKHEFDFQTSLECLQNI